jgi:hypothetical protein
MRGPDVMRIAARCTTCAAWFSNFRSLADDVFAAPEAESTFALVHDGAVHSLIPTGMCHLRWILMAETHVGVDHRWFIALSFIAKLRR